VANLLIFFGAAFVEHIVANTIVAELSKRMTILNYLFTNFSISGLAVCEAYFIILLRKIKTAELENIRLKQEKSNAELAALKEQISPHFFFNTLNSLSSVIRTEKKSHSLDFVENLSQVYRYILDSETTDTVTISEELGFLEAYAYLLKKRFGENLQMQIRVDKKLKNHRIPPMALQTLLENVVKHNQLSKATPVVIRIENQEDNLVATNNIINKKGTKGHGVGLANLNKRYKMIADCEIEIQENADTFIIKLPIIRPGPKSKNG